MSTEVVLSVEKSFILDYVQSSFICTRVVSVNHGHLL